MKNLLITVHCPSPNTLQLRDALSSGSQLEGIHDVNVRITQPLSTDANDVLWANAIILGTTENFGYMSGAMKDFFDRIYYPCLEKTEGLPYAIAIRAGLDGTGTRTAMQKIIGGLKWKEVQAPLVSKGDFKEDFLENWKNLGTTMAAGLEAGIY